MAEATAATPTPAVEAAFDPKGKTFLQRLAAFQAEVLKTHSLTVHKDSGRTAAWQQKHHIAHMFLYNEYSNTTPKQVEPGARTISWSHFQDPKVIWENGISSADFLRTKTGGNPVRDGNGWKKDAEPDKDKTKENVKQMLQSGGVGRNGQAMVSAGFKPCGEPCKCGAGRSLHLEEGAADLNSLDLSTLTAKLVAANAGDIDAYLKQFGLHRPLVNHPKSPEEWHVESSD